MPDPSSSPELDPELLRRAQAGDESAFGQIMRSHYERTFRLVFAIVRNEADARDVCQEVWLTIWKKLGEFRGDARFTTWIHAIATHRSLDHLRKRRRWFDRFLPLGGSDEKDDIAAVPDPAATEAGVTAQLEGQELVDRVRAAIDQLPPKQRAVLALRELEGLSYEEIAASVGVPVGTVMSRLFNARRQLAERLGRPSPGE